LPGLRFHNLRRTAARNMRRGHVSEKVAMEVGGWKTTSVFHSHAIVDNHDVAVAIDMLEKSHDQLHQRLEDVLKTASDSSGVTVNSASAQLVQTTPRGQSHHVGPLETPAARLHRGTRKAPKRQHRNSLGVVPGGGVEPTPMVLSTGGF